MQVGKMQTKPKKNLHGYKQISFTGFLKILKILKIENRKKKTFHFGILKTRKNGKIRGENIYNKHKKIKY
jgi:hypothetical protein